MSTKSYFSPGRLALKLATAIEAEGGVPAEINELAEDRQGIRDLLAVRRGTHEILRKPQVINTDLLVPTDTVINFPHIPKQLTEGAFAIKDEDPSSPFGYRKLTVPLPEKEKPTEAMCHRFHQFTEDMRFSRMVDAAGGLAAVKERHLVTQWQIRHAVDETMRRHKEGKTGLIRMDGWGDFFLVEAKEGVAVVLLYWNADDDVWSVWTRPRSRSVVWFCGCRLSLRAE